MMRRFRLVRDVDHSGVSGCGIVADGVVYDHPFAVTFPDAERAILPAGWVRMTWRTERSSTVLFRSVDDVVAIHGHGGSTRLEWMEDPS